MLASVADEERFPLFPLGLVAVPTEAVPLHIFEERYKTMIEHCLEHESEFGIIWADDEGLREVGCAVMIETVLDRTPDGRMDILCRGTRAFKLIARHEDMAYPAGEVVFLEETVDDDRTDEAERTREVYARLVMEATDRELGPEDLDGLSAYDMAGTVEFGPEAKQTLLELRAEPARMALLEKIFRAALQRVDEVGRAEALARSNGKVRFGAASGRTGD